MRGKQLILVLATFTLFGFSAIGFLINYYFNDITIREVFESEYSLLSQITTGICFGSLSAIVGWQMINSPLLAKVKSKYSNILSSLNLGLDDIIYISICAGVGEEILFRGAIQPLLGIWITAIVFVAIHGYLSPTNWRLTLYGIYMTFIIGIMGYMTAIMGITTAIFAHIFVDIFLFYFLTQNRY